MLKMKKMLILTACLALFLGIGAPVAKAEEAVTLQVIVIALGDAPIENATVTVGDREDTTKNNGSCVFTLPPGDYTICAKGEWGGMTGQKCQDVTLHGTNRFVVLELFQKPSSVW
jgi:hypothetical protein